MARTLREQGGRELDLSINIAYIFFCFSNFSQFHPFLSQNRVGDSCMRIVESELDRAKVMDKDYMSTRKDHILSV